MASSVAMFVGQFSQCCLQVDFLLNYHANTKYILEYFFSMQVQLLVWIP